MFGFLILQPFSDAKMKQYLKVKEQIDPEIDNFITSLSVVDVNVKSELKTFTVYARAKRSMIQP